MAAKVVGLPSQAIVPVYCVVAEMVLWGTAPLTGAVMSTGSLPVRAETKLISFSIIFNFNSLPTASLTA